MAESTFELVPRRELEARRCEVCDNKEARRAAISRDILRVNIAEGDFGGVR